MKIILNGQERNFEAPLTISGLLQGMGLGERRVAVEVNREIVPRSQHGAHELKDNDRVEVVFAIGGGSMSREQGPREAGMRPSANAAGRRQNGLQVLSGLTEAAHMSNEQETAWQ